ncbi:MAG: hypothetical protein WC600_17070 [Desulfobaccales bacterium]
MAEATDLKDLFKDHLDWLTRLEIMHGEAPSDRIIKITFPWWTLDPPCTHSEIMFAPADVPVLREFCREHSTLLDFLTGQPGHGLSGAFMKHLTLIGQMAEATYNALITPPPRAGGYQAD